MLAQLVVSRRPAALLSVFDADWRPAWRVAAYPGYKAARAAEPPELTAQFAVIGQVLDAAGLPVLAAAGYEADDVIGTLAATATAATRLDIVSGDRDLLQLVRDPVVRLLFTMRGVSQLHTFDEAAVLEKYGIPAARYVDFAILRGDPSDGLPGVRGVGEKAAAALVIQHPTLDAAVIGAATTNPRVAPALRAAADYLDAMQVVVPVRTDLGLQVPPRRAPNRPRLSELAAEHGLGGSIERLIAAIALLPDDQP